MTQHKAGVGSFVMKFVEIIDEVGKRLHVGCVMAAGQDWVEVSLPQHSPLGRTVQVRFTCPAGGPLEERFGGLAGLLNPRPAALKFRC